MTVIAVAAVAVVAVLTLHLYPRTGSDRVQHVLNWSACTSVERRDFEPDYAVRWTEIRSQVDLVCQDLGPQVYYVKFDSSAARRLSLRRSAPDEPYCVYGDAELVAYTEVMHSERKRTCDKLGGSLR